MTMFGGVLGATATRYGPAAVRSCSVASSAGGAQVFYRKIAPGRQAAGAERGTAGKRRETGQGAGLLASDSFVDLGPRCVAVHAGLTSWTVMGHGTLRRGVSGEERHIRAWVVALRVRRPGSGPMQLAAYPTMFGRRLSLGLAGPICGSPATSRNPTSLSAHWGCSARPAKRPPVASGPKRRHPPGSAFREHGGTWAKKSTPRTQRLETFSAIDNIGYGRRRGA